MPPAEYLNACMILCTALVSHIFSLHFYILPVQFNGEFSFKGFMCLALESKAIQSSKPVQSFTSTNIVVHHSRGAIGLTFPERMLVTAR